MKVYFETLGCPKNFYDTENAKGILEDAGFEICDSPETADFVVVNTCGFINDAKTESIERIFDMASAKRDDAKLVVSGCLSKRYAEELFEEMPEADAFVGVNEYEKLPDLLRRLSENPGERKVLCENGYDEVLKPLPRKLDENPYTATLKIAEGCDNVCAYCIIPFIRGGYRSKKMEDVVAEARALAEAGCRELILIAQDVTCYGLDLYGRMPIMCSGFNALASLGVANYNTKYKFDGTSEDKQRIGYRAGVGLSYDFNNNVSFRLMGRYSYLGMASLDNLMEVTAGLRYTF